METFAITQIEEFSRRGIKCFVLARNGILVNRLKDKDNIKFIDFDFQLKNYIDYKKVNMLEDIVKKNKIDFIYVHQFSCVPYILPVVFKTRVPYVAYLHNVVPKTCEWFMDTYDIYKILFPIYFEYASKIIAITENVMQENADLFHQPKEKYIITNNSLDFTNYPNKKIEKLNYPYNKFLLFGRISEEKKDSIETAIDFYIYCKKKYNPNIKLTVVGDGNILNEMVEKYSSQDIYFKGAVSDMRPEIENADVLLGVDRCALESVASKKPTIVCGYNKTISLITPKNIKEAVKQNFTGINLKSDKDELYQYREDELIKIINKNYEYVSEKLQITNSIFLDIAPFKSDSDFENLFLNLNCYSTKIKDLEKENKRLFDDTQKLYKELGTVYQQIEELNNKGIKVKLKNIYNKIMGDRR